MDGTASQLRDLLQHERWLTGLVRQLVDPAAVDDVVQQTWLKALESPPEKQNALRSWLARVARNFAMEYHRARHRRQDRELDAARDGRVPSAREIVERLELHAILTRAVHF